MVQRAMKVETLAMKKSFIGKLIFALAISGMLTVTVLAHDSFAENDVATIIYYKYSDGHITTQRASSLCGCANSNVRTYKLSHVDNRPNDLCTVVVREYCNNCGWYRDVETYGVGGHSNYYSYPQWPYSW